MTQSIGLPVSIDVAGERARVRSIQNHGTRAVYANAVQRFLSLRLIRNIIFDEIKPMIIVTCVEQLGA